MRFIACALLLMVGIGVFLLPFAIIPYPFVKSLQNTVQLFVFLGQGFCNGIGMLIVKYAVKWGNRK